MKVIHVATTIANEAAGPSYSVPNLAQAQARLGASAQIFSVDPEPCVETVAGVLRRRFRQDHEHVPLLSTLSLSRAFKRGLDEALKDSDMVHVHGLWRMPNVYPAAAARRHRRPLVISPRGMLAPGALRFSRTSKRAFWTLLQGHAVAAAGTLHATAQSEYEEIRRFGLRMPVCVIPNGIDLPGLPEARPSAASRTVLFLGRLHPVKGLDRLIAAWARVAAKRPEWRLRIVGPDEGGYAQELRALIARVNAPAVVIEPPLFGADKLVAYREADLFVLPTFNENFGMAVAEALAAETPVICTKGAPWRGLETEGCGWWIDHGVEPLASALEQVLGLPRARLHEMGAKGRAWMAREFSWDRAGANMLDVYRWLAEGGEPPATVRIE